MLDCPKIETFVVFPAVLTFKNKIQQEMEKKSTIMYGNRSHIHRKK